MKTTHRIINKDSSQIANIHKFVNPDCYNSLSEEEKHVAHLIEKYYKYFKKKDEKYKKTVQTVKVSILLLAIISTIILGLKNVLKENCQINMGLILSTTITFLTALSSFFNFEKYWIRNIFIYTELNILRDNFICEVEAKKIDEYRLDYYRERLDFIQNKNVKYWENVIKNI